MRSCAETLKTQILFIFTILEACRPPPKMLKNRLKIDLKREAYALKKVPKDSPRASNWNLKRSQNHEKSMLWPARCNRASFSSPKRTLEVGTGSKIIEHLQKIRWKHVDKILAIPADMPAEFPPVQAVKLRALFQNSF